MPKKTKVTKGARKGPKQVQTLYEGQAEILGLPLQYVHGMLMPETSDPVRVPDEVVATSAVFGAPNVIESLPFTGSWNATTAATGVIGVDLPGETTIMVFPGTVGTIWHSAESSFASVSPVHARSSLYDSTSTITTSGIRWMAHGLRVSDTGFFPRFTRPEVPMFQILRNDGAPNIMTVAVSTDTGFSGDTFVRVRTVIAGIFTVVDTPITFIAGAGEASVSTIVGITEGMGIGVATVSGLPDALKFSISDTNLWISPQNNATMFTIRHLDQLLNMPLTSVERPTALSALCTFMGSTLKNGGNIAGARLPMGMNLAQAPLGDYYSFIASLPLYAGDFPLKDGCYSWWCPDSEQEYFFRPYGEYACDDLDERSSLVFTMRRDDPNETVRLRVDIHVETQTRSALFTSRVSDYSATFPRALELAKTISAVTINQNHESILHRAWSGIKNLVSNPTNWIKLISTGLKFLA